MLKIDLVSEHASPLATVGTVDAGGQNVHVAALATHLGDLGHSVVVHTRRDDPSIETDVPFAPNVEVHHVDAGPAEPVPKDELLPHMDEFADELHRHWQRHRPDVVHAHFWMSGYAAVRAARPLGIPLAQTFHALGSVKRFQQGAADTSPPSRVAIERGVACSADAVIATTESEVAELERLGMRRERAHVVPCGVDTTRFAPVGPVWPASTGRPRVVVVSRLVERKGIGNVISAVAMLPEVELLIAGGAPGALLDSDPEAQRFVRLARALGVDDRVTLLGGVDRERIPALLRSADIVACCPWYEPFGLVALEGMACGVPIVATAVGGLAESVVHHETGLLVPPRRPHEIAAACSVLLSEPRFARRLGASGAVRAFQYSWPMIAARTHEVLVGLTAQHATPEAVLR